MDSEESTYNESGCYEDGLLPMDMLPDSLQGSFAEDEEVELEPGDTAIAELLAESFYQGWVPTELSEEYMKALELSANWEPTLRELKQLAHTWEMRLTDRQSIINQLESLRYTLQQTYEQTLAVEPPEHPAMVHLLCALQEGFHALIESCVAFSTALEHYVDSGIAQAIASAELASNILRNIYAGTHFAEEKYEEST